MYTSVELTRSIVLWATMVLADESSSAEKKREAAARAKLQVSRAGRHVGQEAIQLHGGIGMTAEYAVGHLTARLTAIDHLLGDGRQQVRNLSRRLTSYGVVEPLPCASAAEPEPAAAVPVAQVVRYRPVPPRPLR